MAIEKAMTPMDGINVDDPGIEVVLPGEEEVIQVEVHDTFNDNLAESMDEDILRAVAEDLLEDVDNDLQARQDWMKSYIDGLNLLGMKITERQDPWPGACGVTHPLLAEALVSFQSEAIVSTFPAEGPVKVAIIGKETPEKKEAAARVKEDMNWRLTTQMPEYRSEHERMLWGLGLSGNAFKKVYYDPDLQRQTSMYVPAEDIVVPYGVSTLAASPRITHIMRKTPNELRKLQVAGFYRDVPLGEPMDTLSDVEKKIAQHQGFDASNDARFRVLEIHVEYNLPGYEDTDDSGEQTGIALPYVVTVERGTGEVLAIRRNWQPDDETHAARQHFVHYGYIPGFGFYCYGLVHLIGAFADSGTSLLRQLVDSGTLANLPGGFKARAMRVDNDNEPMRPGQFKDVDVPAGTIKDNILPLPYKEPSQTLMTLMQGIIEEGRRFANMADLKVSDMSAEAPVGTTLAILEQALKPMTAVQGRIHASMKQELKLLKDIIASYTSEDYEYDPDTGVRHAKASDYASTDVIPVSDPNASTMAQKIVKYQAVMQLAQTAPQLYNLPLLHRQMLEAMGVKDAAKLIPMDDNMKPTDPVSENQDILAGKPVKAWPAQDHNAHITVHMAAMQDPMVQQLLSMNPASKQMQAAMMAHINEHLGWQYRHEIEAQLGFALPAPQDENGDATPMDPEVEARLSPMLAQAAQRLLMQDQAQQAQQQAAQAQQDPLVQMQQQELQIKQGELQRKMAKDQMDAQARERDQAISAAKVLAQNGAAVQRQQMANQHDSLKTAATLREGKDNMLIQAGIDALKQLSSQANQGGNQ